MTNKITISPRVVSPQWQAPGLVARFKTNAPNSTLMTFAQGLQQKREEPLCVLDIGGGAGRNAIPLAQMGMEVFCTDLSAPMLQAAQEKLNSEQPAGKVHLIEAPMEVLPFPERKFDLIIAHGIWNLANSGAEFRAAIGEAARVAKEGASLFLFTFSRHTLPPQAMPVAGEKFVFTQFNDEPQCFLEENEIVCELGAVGFKRNPAGPLTEHNRPVGPTLVVQRPPVIYEGTFVFHDPNFQ